MHICIAAKITINQFLSYAVYLEPFHPYPFVLWPSKQAFRGLILLLVLLFLLCARADT